MIYRQGDVILKPAKAKGTPAKDNILAHGEKTGHRHELKSPQIAVLEHEGKKTVRLNKPTILAHEEHKHLTILPGSYEVLQEREFDPFLEQIKGVAD